MPTAPLSLEPCRSELAAGDITQMVGLFVVLMCRLIALYGTFGIAFLLVTLGDLHCPTQRTLGGDWRQQCYADTFGKGKILQWDMCSLGSTRRFHDSSGAGELCRSSIRHGGCYHALFALPRTRCYDGAHSFSSSISRPGALRSSTLARGIASEGAFSLNCIHSQQVDWAHRRALTDLGLFFALGQIRWTRQFSATKLANVSPACLSWGMNSDLRLEGWLPDDTWFASFFRPTWQMGVGQTGTSPIREVLSTIWGWLGVTERPTTSSQTQRCFSPACEHPAGGGIYERKKPEKLTELDDLLVKYADQLEEAAVPGLRVDGRMELPWRFAGSGVAQSDGTWEDHNMPWGYGQRSGFEREMLASLLKGCWADVWLG
eukprot:Skav229120  [mRNA]  locus=scaffold92:831008:834676:+ [translate_table: standard]